MKVIITFDFDREWLTMTVNQAVECDGVAKGYEVYKDKRYVFGDVITSQQDCIAEVKKKYDILYVDWKNNGKLDRFKLIMV